MNKLLFLMLFVGCANMQMIECDSLLDTPVRIVAIGDSTTAGSVGNDVYAPYTDVFKNRWVVINKGDPGETSTQIAARFGVDVLFHSPSLAIIWAGQNDLNIHRTADEIAYNLKSMVKMSMDNGIIPMLITPAIWPLAYEGFEPKERIKQIKKLRKWLEQYARNNNICALSIKKSISDDGTHPNAKQYQEIGERVESLINSMI